MNPRSQAGVSGASPSILWVSPIFDPSGYADEARQFILHLRAQNRDMAARSLGRVSETFRAQLDPASRGLLDSVLQKPIHTPYIGVIHAPGYALDRLPEASWTIGRTMFETDGLPPDWVEKCNRMDEIWVPSAQNLESFRKAGVTVNVVKIPEGVDTERYRPGLEPLALPGVRGTVFLSIFEWIYRKGWDVLLTSWARAFKPDADVTLVVRAYPINATDPPNAREEIERRIDQFLRSALGLKRSEVAPIVVLGDQIPDREMPRLYAAARVYVSPSRGEGWGRTPMEAMSCGLPTIATAWGGTREFMNASNSLPLNYEMAVVDERCEIPFYRGHRWADPSAAHLTELLRAAAAEPERMNALGRQARHDMATHWGWEKIAAQAGARIDELQREPAFRRRALPAQETTPTKAPPPTMDTKAIDDLLERADICSRAGNLGGAREALLRAVALDPNDPRPLTALGAILFQLQDHPAAIERFKRALALKPNEPGTLVKLALAYLGLDQIEPFETALGQALALDPSNREALLALGNLSLQQGQWQEAGQAYARILEKNPNDVDALLPLGICLNKAGEWETAKLVYEKVLTLSPDHPVARRHVDALKKKLEGDIPTPTPPVPETPSGRDPEAGKILDQARFFEEIGNQEAAIESLERAVELLPANAAVRMALGCHCFARGKYEAARDHFRRLIELRPRDPDAYTRLAMSCVKLNRIDEMESALGIALEIDPNDREALKFLAKTNFENNRFRDAGRSYARLVELRADDIESLLCLGLCFYRGGDLVSAKMVYQRVAEIDPGNELALENLARLDQPAEQAPSRPSRPGLPTKSAGASMELGVLLARADTAYGSQDLATAREALTSALGLAPQHPEILSALGSLCFQLGDMKEARRHLKRLVEISSADASQWVRLALAHYQLEETSDFEKALRRALEIDPNHIEALRLLAHLNFNHGSLVDAARIYGQVLRQSPNDVEILMALGVCFYKVRDFDAAKMMFERTVQLDPHNAIARSNLKAVREHLNPRPAAPSAPPANLLQAAFAEADRALAQGDVRAASAALERAANDAPDDVDVLACHGSLLFQLGEFARSHEMIARAQRLRPESPDLLTRLALASHKLGRAGEFESSIQRALEIDPGFGAALRLRADSHFQAGKIPLAAQAYHRLLLQRPDDIEVLMALAVCFYKSGDLATAQLMFERVLELRPDHEMARDNLALVRGKNAAIAAPFSTPAAGAPKESIRQEEPKQSQPPVIESKSVESGPRASGPAVIWEGSQFLHHSLALVNRELCLALIHGGQELSLRPYEPDQFTPEPGSRFGALAARVSAPLSKTADIHLRHQWPPNFTPPPQGRWIVIQPWEYGSMPLEWVAPMRDLMDEIWVPSQCVRQCYLAGGVPEEKVVVIPNGVNPDLFYPGIEPLPLPTQKRFKFLFVGGTIRRKGADILVNAYLERFRREDDVCLVIKDFSTDGLYRGQNLESQIRGLQTNPNAPEICYLNTNLAPEDLPRLYAACDCLVHPYRGEGFALPVLEAMAVGLPVIITAGGSTDDFAADDVAYRVPAARQSIGDQVGEIRLAAEGWLLEPDVAAVGAKMRHVFQNPGDARALGLKASERVRRDWTWAKAAERARDRLAALASSSEPPVRNRAGAPTTPAIKGPVEIPPAGYIGSLGEAQKQAAKKNHKAAWKAGVEAIELRPFHPEAYLQLADIALAAGDERQAFLCAERLVRLTPQWKIARNIHRSLSEQKSRAGTKIRWRPLPKELEVPRLSVCLIVKNEEEHLRRCLASIKPIAWQIVVVDTGSTDQTVAIAREFGAEVYHFAWNDNFSDARNAAHEHARGDWVLILDADEELPLESHPSLLKDMAVANVLGYRIPICNLQEDDLAVTYVPRLFRNAPALFFIGRVHEQIYATVIARKSEWGMEAVLGTAKILHHGYDPELVKRRQKIKRNLRLLEVAIEEMPGEAALVMNYGLDLVNDGQLEKGLEMYRRAVSLVMPHPAEAVLPEVRERLLTLFGVHLMRANRFEEIVQLMVSKLAIDSGPTASMSFLCALALMKMGRSADAIPHLQAALRTRELPALTPPCREIHGAGPLLLLSECYSKTGRIPEAGKVIAQALELEPDSPACLSEQALWLHQTDQSLPALEALHAAIGRGINDRRLWHVGAFIANSRPDYGEFALDWTGEAIRFFPEEQSLLNLRAETLLKAGLAAEALTLFKRSEQAGEPAFQAAAILCQLFLGEPDPRVNTEDELRVSREFIAWYRRLLAAKAAALTSAVIERIPILQSALPTAADILSQAVKEANA